MNDKTNWLICSIICKNAAGSSSPHRSELQVEMSQECGISDHETVSGTSSADSNPWSEDNDDNEH